MDAPTIVQSSVLLAIGTRPSTPRLKQLAQTIKGNSHSTNLGLNNTTFGKVKQVRLSSILQHSLNGGDGGSGSSPSPSPMPYSLHHHHHIHHHHHPPFGPTMPPTPATKGGNSPTWGRISPTPLPSPHAQERHSHLRSPAPSIIYKAKPPHSHSPTPSITYEAKPPHSHSPAPSITYEAKPPSCRYGQKRSPGPAPEQSHVSPTAAPAFTPRKSVTPLPPKKHELPPPPSSLNNVQGPFPHAAYGSVHPPSKSKSDSAPSISSSPSSCAYSKWCFLVLYLFPCGNPSFDQHWGYLIWSWKANSSLVSTSYFNQLGYHICQI